MPSKTNRSSLSAPVKRAILRKSVAGIELKLDEFKFDDDDEDLGYAAKAGKTMSGIAGTLASQLNLIIKSSNKPKLSLEEMTTYMRNDPKLWQEFLKEINDAKLVTHFGVREVLNKFLHEREEDIVAAYRVEKASTLSGVTAAASSVKRRIQKRASLSFLPRFSPSGCSDTNQPMPCRARSNQKRASMSLVPRLLSSNQHNDCSDIPQFMPCRTTINLGHQSSKTTDSTLSGVSAAASSVKRSIQKRVSMSFLPKLSSSSDQHADCSDILAQRISELPCRVTFDFGESCSNLVKQTSAKFCRMSVDSFHRKSSRRIITAQNTGMQPETLIEKSAQCHDELPSKYEPSSSHKYHGNAVKMELVKTMATSDKSFATSKNYSEIRGAELLETWGSRKTRSSVKTAEEKKNPVKAFSYESDFSKSLSYKSMNGNSSSSRKLNTTTPMTSKTVANTRAYFDAQFHFQKKCDVPKAKNIMPTLKNAMQASINDKTVKKVVNITPCIFDTAATPDMGGRNSDGNLFITCFQSSQSMTPVELVTYYLD